MAVHRGKPPPKRDSAGESDYTIIFIFGLILRIYRECKYYCATSGIALNHRDQRHFFGDCRPFQRSIKGGQRQPHPDRQFETSQHRRRTIGGGWPHHPPAPILLQVASRDPVRLEHYVAPWNSLPGLCPRRGVFKTIFDSLSPSQSRPGHREAQLGSSPGRSIQFEVASQSGGALFHSCQSGSGNGKHRIKSQTIIC